jgi:hypothetical protein
MVQLRASDGHTKPACGNASMPPHRQAEDAADRHDLHRPIQLHRERTTVQLMRTIYGAVLHVLVWLGSSSEDSWHATSLVPRLLRAKKAQSAQSDERRYYQLGPEGWQDYDSQISLTQSAPASGTARARLVHAGLDHPRARSLMTGCCVVWRIPI